jgi:hypothetical protein
VVGHAVALQHVATNCNSVARSPNYGKNEKLLVFPANSSRIISSVVPSSSLAQALTMHYGRAAQLNLGSLRTLV